MCILSLVCCFVECKVVCHIGGDANFGVITYTRLIITVAFFILYCIVLCFCHCSLYVFIVCNHGLSSYIGHVIWQHKIYFNSRTYYTIWCYWGWIGLYYWLCDNTIKDQSVILQQLETISFFVAFFCLFCNWRCGEVMYEFCQR